MGGRGAGRSMVASQYAVSKLFGKRYFRCAIMRYIAGDIRHSIYQDIHDRLEETERIGSVEVKENLLTFLWGENKINGLGFKKSSGDQTAKLKSLAGYNCIVIEEADEISEEDFMQLDDSLRTMKGDIKIILLLNPPSKNHWIIKRWFNLSPSEVEGFYRPTLKESRTDTTFIHSTYLDNLRNISLSTRENYEGYKKTKPDHYYNMIRGLVSEGARGRIFKNWTTMRPEDFDKIPYPSTFGLDFGFTNDPTALVEVKKHRNKAWVRQLIYETGMTNPGISRRLRELEISKSAPIYADSAEPKSIRELSDDGWNVLPAEKGPDSINAGIDMLLDMEIVYTEDSVDIAKESQEYKWALDKNKEPTNKPIDKWNHGMDAIRYDIYTEKVMPVADAF
jgi:phage terminase large subunit